MLVLTRRPYQSLMIGDPILMADPDASDSVIEIVVVEIRRDPVHGDQVRIGIKAPGDVTVHRKEIWVQVQEGEGASDRAEQPILRNQGNQ